MQYNELGYQKTNYTEKSDPLKTHSSAKLDLTVRSLWKQTYCRTIAYSVSAPPGLNGNRIRNHLLK